MGSLTCRWHGCRRQAMPDWAYCREHANDVILGRTRCSRDDDPSQNDVPR